jgi:hypothetical protein
MIVTGIILLVTGVLAKIGIVWTTGGPDSRPHRLAARHGRSRHRRTATLLLRPGAGPDHHDAGHRGAQEGIAVSVSRRSSALLMPDPR